MNLDLYTKVEIHRLLAELRGRAVSRDKAEKSVRKFFGYFLDEPHARLHEPSDPWQIQYHLHPSYVPGLGESISWFNSKAKALSAALESIDTFRIYPDQILPTQDGGIVLLKEGAQLLEIVPVRWFQPNAETRQQILSWVRDADDSRVNLVRSIGALPTLERLEHPIDDLGYAFDPDYDDDGEEPLCRLDRDSYAQDPGPLLADFLQWPTRFQALVEAHRLKISDEDAQKQVARLLGFSSWERASQAWADLKAFDPYIVYDRVSKCHWACRDVVDALAALAQACESLAKGKHHWTYREAMGRLNINVYRGGKHSRRDHENASIELLQFKESSRWRQYHSEIAWGHTTEESIDRLGLIIGLSLMGSDRIGRSNMRRKVHGLQVGKALILTGHDPSVHRDRAPSDSISVEFLRTDGWRDLPAERRYFTNHPRVGATYPLKFHAVVLGTLGGLQIGQLNKPKMKNGQPDFFTSAKIVKASTEEVAELIEFLALSPTNVKSTLFEDVGRQDRELKRMNAWNPSEMFEAIAESHMNFTSPWKRLDLH